MVTTLMNQENIFSMERCLDLMEISTVADFIMYSLELTDSELIDHVIECPKCRLEVIELVEICSNCGDDEEDEGEEPYQLDMDLIREYCRAYLAGEWNNGPAGK